MTNCRSVSPRACKKSSKSVGMGANGEPCKTPKLRKTDVDTPHTNKCTLASVKMLASDMGRRSHDKMFPKPRTSGRLRTLKVVISLGTSSKNRQSTPMSPNGGSSKCGDAETGLEDPNKKKCLFNENKSADLLSSACRIKPLHLQSDFHTWELVSLIADRGTYNLTCASTHGSLYPSSLIVLR